MNELNELGHNLKIRHSAIVVCVVTYMYAKCCDDRLRNEKALVLLITTRRITTRTTLIALGNPFSGTKKSQNDGTFYR